MYTLKLSFRGKMLFSGMNPNAIDLPATSNAHRGPPPTFPERIVLVARPRPIRYSYSI